MLCVRVRLEDNFQTMGNIRNQDKFISEIYLYLSDKILIRVHSKLDPSKGEPALNIISFMLGKRNREQPKLRKPHDDKANLYGCEMQWTEG